MKPYCRNQLQTAVWHSVEFVSCISNEALWFVLQSCDEPAGIWLIRVLLLVFGTFLLYPYLYWSSPFGWLSYLCNGNQFLLVLFGPINQTMLTVCITNVVCF